MLDEALFWAGLKEECPLLYRKARRIPGTLFQRVQVVCDSEGIDRPLGHEPIIVTLNRVEAALRRKLHA